MLESIRMLQDQMQLKDMVIDAFMPPEEVQKVRRLCSGGEAISAYHCMLAYMKRPLLVPLFKEQRLRQRKSPLIN